MKAVHAAAVVRHYETGNPLGKKKKALEVWAMLGHALGRVVSPIVLGVIFFLVLTPIAVFGRLAGRDELRLKARQRDSHWIEREASEPSRTSFKNQF